MVSNICYFHKKLGKIPNQFWLAHIFHRRFGEVNHQLEKHQEILQLSVSRGGRAELAVTPAGQYDAMVAAETQVGLSWWVEVSWVFDGAVGLIRYGCFLKWWYPTTIGFPTKNDLFGVFWGYPYFGNTHILPWKTDQGWNLKKGGFFKRKWHMNHLPTLNFQEIGEFSGEDSPENYHFSFEKWWWNQKETEPPLSAVHFQVNHVSFLELYWYSHDISKRCWTPDVFFLFLCTENIHIFSTFESILWCWGGMFKFIMHWKALADLHQASLIPQKQIVAEVWTGGRMLRMSSDVRQKSDNVNL